MRWYALGLVLVSAACGDGAKSFHGPKLKANVDLSHVIGFAIVPQAAARGPAAPMCTPSTLYALQDDGTMAVTTVMEAPDGNGSASCTTSMMNERASAIFDTPGYVVIDYEGGISANCVSEGHCDACSYVLARKSDGALFCGTTSFGSPDQVKSTGSILYVKQGASLQRVDATMDPPVVTAVNDPSMESVDVFNVNAANDVLATGSFGTRIFKANGGLMNISVDRPVASWLNPADGLFYYAPTHTVSGGMSLLDVTRLANTTYAPTTVSEFINSFGTIPSGAPIPLATATQTYSWVNAPTSGMLVELLPSAAGGVCKRVGANNLSCSSDVDCGSTATCSFNAGCGCMACNGGFHNGGMCSSDAECQDTCNGPGGANHVLNGVNVIKNMLGTGNTLYVQGSDTSGNGMIVSVDTGTIGEVACQTPVPVGACNFGCCSSAITPTTLLPAGDYTITATSLSKNGELTFAGLRNSDGARIVGNCVGGTCSVLNATAPMVTALQRIN